jgi:putative ABC transport system permease protein
MSVIALVISCMGLFGLAALTAARRTKEVGIRKALGATVSSVLMLMSREFAWTAVAGNVIAWPIAYVALDRWLTMYAYRIDIGVLSFGLAGLLVLGIAMMTVSGQILRVARTNPVEALRYE